MPVSAPMAASLPRPKPPLMRLLISSQGVGTGLYSSFCIRKSKDSTNI